MVGVAFFLFVTTKIAHNCGSYTIDVLRESHYEIIFMIIFLTVTFIIIEVMEKLPHSLLLIRRSKLIIKTNIRNEVLLVSVLFLFNLYILTLCKLPAH